MKVFDVNHFKKWRKTQGWRNDVGKNTTSVKKIFFVMYQKRKEKFDMKTQVSFWFFLPENSANKTLKIVSLFCANKLNFCRKKGKQGGGSSYSNIQQIKPYIFFCYTAKTYLISGGTIFFEKGNNFLVLFVKI